MLKIVMVINSELPVGLAANAAAVLGITLGSEKKEIIGPDCKDGTDIVHKGITSATIPILATDGGRLKAIYQKSIQADNVDVIDFNQIAQRSRRYDDYVNALSNTENDGIEISGLCLSGPRKAIEKLTGALGLYR